MTDQEINDRFDETAKDIVHLTELFEDIRKDVRATKEIVEAWAAVKTGGKFLRWIGGVLVSIGAIYASIRFGFGGLGK